jgi:predicted transcriptional regulator
MYKTLREKRDMLKALRKQRDLLKSEKADMWNRALASNPQIDDVRKELEGMRAERSKITEDIEKLLAKRRGMSKAIKDKCAEIRMKGSTKKTMFDACRGKKAEIMEVDKNIMKVQAEIAHILGRDREWR